MAMDSSATQNFAERLNASDATGENMVNIEKTVLDACCGSRMFWFDKTDGRALFLDKRREVCLDNSVQGKREIVIDPDILGDFRSLPFEDNTFSLVVFDPPHTFSGPNGYTAKKYGSLEKGWRDDIAAGFRECFRVLCPKGTLIFKWNEKLANDVRAAIARSEEV